MNCTSMNDNWDRSFNACFRECNMQGTSILFSQASVVRAQSLIEITPAVIVGFEYKEGLTMLC